MGARHQLLGAERTSSARALSLRSRAPVPTRPQAPREHGGASSLASTVSAAARTVSTACPSGQQETQKPQMEAMTKTHANSSME